MLADDLGNRLQIVGTSSTSRRGIVGAHFANRLQTIVKMLEMIANRRQILSKASANRKQHTGKHLANRMQILGKSFAHVAGIIHLTILELTWLTMEAFCASKLVFKGPSGNE